MMKLKVRILVILRFLIDIFVYIDATTTRLPRRSRCRPETSYEISDSYAPGVFISCDRRSDYVDDDACTWIPRHEYCLDFWVMISPGEPILLCFVLSFVFIEAKRTMFDVFLVILKFCWTWNYGFCPSRTVFLFLNCKLYIVSRRDYVCNIKKLNWFIPS